MGSVHPTPAISETFNERIKTLKENNSLFEIANTVMETAIGIKCSDVKKELIRELISAQTVEGFIANCGIIAKAGYQTDKFLEYYRNITAKTLLILGEEDDVAPWTGCAEVIYENLKNREVHRLAGVNHWHAIEEAEKVLNAIESFIE